MIVTTLSSPRRAALGLLLGGLLLVPAAHAQPTPPSTSGTQSSPGSNGAYPVARPPERTAPTDAQPPGPAQADQAAGQTRGPAVESSPAPAPPVRESDLMVGVRHELSSIGLRFSLMQVQSKTSDEGAWGIGLGSHGERFQNLGVATARTTHFFTLGGGNAGFEGGVELATAVGFRLPVGEHHGPVVRLGVQGWIWGNRLLYSSLLEIPQGQVGYQYVAGKTVLEVTAQAGPVLVGRYSAGDEHTVSFRLGKSLEYSAHGSIHVDKVHLHGSVMRVDPGSADERPHVDIARASLCLWPSVIAVCADAHWLRADAGDRSLGPSGEVHSSYIGLLVGGPSRD